MRKNRRNPGSKMLLAALLMSLFSVGTSRAQVGLQGYVAKFTLTNQIRWDRSVLQPGDYTITIGFTASPAVGIIRNREGRSVGIVMSMVHSDNASVARSALLIKEKDGQLCVHSLVLAGLKRVLIYDPVLAQQSVHEAEVSETVPLIWAKK